MNTIGVDVGGTSVRAGRVGASGDLKHLVSAPTPANDSDGLLEWIAHAVIQLRDDIASDSENRDTDALLRVPVGLALPGIIDPARGTVTRCVNLPGLENRPIVREIQRATGNAVTLTTDADASTQAEYAVRSTQDIGRFIHLRLGTGVACGLIVRGRCEYIEPNRNGHLDALVVDSSATALSCPCGKRGCLETVASGKALSRRAAEAGLPEHFSIRCSEPRALARADAGLETHRDSLDDPSARRMNASDSDGVTESIISTAANALATALNNLDNLCRPDVICIGGGIIEEVPALYKQAVAHWKSEEFTKQIKRRAACERARLGDSAGVIGAAIIARNRANPVPDRM